MVYYQSVLPTQLNYNATPVIVMFLSNPVEDLDTAKVKMLELQSAWPPTYFMGVLLSFEPTISQLPFNYVYNYTVPPFSGVNDMVDTIFRFICTFPYMEDMY